MSEDTSYLVSRFNVIVVAFFISDVVTSVSLCVSGFGRLSGFLFVCLGISESVSVCGSVCLFLSVILCFLVIPERLFWLFHEQSHFTII